jgi:hypothetical protein
MEEASLIDRLNGESRVLVQLLFERFPEWIDFAEVWDGTALDGLPDTV